MKKGDVYLTLKIKIMNLGHIVQNRCENLEQLQTRPIKKKFKNQI